MISPDPVREAAAYQAMLLGALGDDDPAKVQASTPATVRALLAEAGEDLRTPPEPGEWSVLQCVGPHARRRAGRGRPLSLDPGPG